MRRIGTFLCFLCLGIALSPVNTEAAAPAGECTKYDGLMTALGVETMTWIGYPRGWDFPDDIQFQEPSEIVFEDGTSVWAYESPSTGQRFAFYFPRQTSPPDPVHPGLHDFCGPYVTADKAS